MVMPSQRGHEAGQRAHARDAGGLRSNGCVHRELVKAGIFVAAAGLQNTARAKRILFDEAGQTVIDGPFAESRELIAFSIWQVKDMDEAAGWARRAPVIPARKSEMEIRPLLRSRGPRRLRDPRGTRRCHPRRRTRQARRRLTRSQT